MPAYLAIDSYWRVGAKVKRSQVCRKGAKWRQLQAELINERVDEANVLYGEGHGDWWQCRGEAAMHQQELRSSFACQVMRRF